MALPEPSYMTGPAMAELEFCLLGPLLVRSGDEVVPIRRGRQRALLATLLLNAGRPVSVDELAESLWGSGRPPSAPVVIRNYVMRLRHSLGQAAASRIRTQPAGYLINVEAGELDVARFGDLLASVRAAARSGAWAAAADRAGSALGLWRGEPLADVESDMLALLEVPRLTELRLQAVEARADASLRLNRHAEVTGELERFAAAHPLREHLSALLMLAYYRAGRPADALDVYWRVHRALVSDLGMEPGPELRELQQRMLRGDADVSGPACGLTTRGVPAAITASGPAQVDPHQLPTRVRHFVGRVPELMRLSALAAAAEAGSAAAIAVIEGTAGVGKTALAVHWAHHAADRFGDGQLYVNLRGFGPEAPLEPSVVVRGFLDALGVPAQRIPVGPDAQADLYRSLLYGKKMLVLLDNARDGEQVRPLLPGGPGCLVLVTSRGQLTGLGQLTGPGDARDGRPVSLGVLSQAEACELLARRLGAAQSAVIRELADLCAGLPLALSIVAAIATAHPSRSLEELAAELKDGRGQLDTLDAGDTATSVRAVFSWSYRRLGEPAARMFRLLSIHPGPDISLPAAASLAGLPVAQARAALGELRAAHLAREEPPGRFSFHDLLRTYAAEQCRTRDAEKTRRAAARGVLDHYLHTGSAAAAQFPAAFAAPLPALTPPAQGVALEKQDSRDQALAWFRAEHKALIAVIAWAATGFDDHAMRIPLIMRPFLDQGGYWQDSVTTGSTALAAARRLGDTLGQAYAHYHLGTTHTNLGAFREADTHLREALALYREIGHSTGQGVSYIGLENMCEKQRRPADALHHAEQALSQFRAAGDRRGEGGALNNVGWCHILLGNPRRALPFLREAIALQRDQAMSCHLVNALDSLGYAHYFLGRHRQAITYYRRAEGYCRQFAAQFLLATILDHLGDAYRAMGEPQAARRAWERARDILTDLGHPDAEGIRDKVARLPAAAIRA